MSFKRKYKVSYFLMLLLNSQSRRLIKINVNRVVTHYDIHICIDIYIYIFQLECKKELLLKCKKNHFTHKIRRPNA